MKKDRLSIKFYMPLIFTGVIYLIIRFLFKDFYEENAFLVLNVTLFIIQIAFLYYSYGLYKKARDKRDKNPRSVYRPNIVVMITTLTLMLIYH